MDAKQSRQVTPPEMLDVFQRILLQEGFDAADAQQTARIFCESSIDGVYTHGVNRFFRFVEYVRKGYVQPGQKPSLESKAGNIEQWDGNLGPGPLNALFSTEQAMNIARNSGIGCVALSNTNHWMRGGTYGWHAAKQGFFFIGFTNTIANMPAWGALDKKLGNNPLVIAIPYQEEAIVLDMAMSQYSIGALHQTAMKGEFLPVQGGFDERGELTKDPAAILNSGRPLAIGYWKGSGLALLLDILAALLSGGLSTAGIGKNESEYAVSQVYIAVDCSMLKNYPSMNSVIDDIIADYTQARVQERSTPIIYPGQRVLQTRERNLKHGIPVLTEVWNEIMGLLQS